MRTAGFLFLILAGVFGSASASAQTSALSGRAMTVDPHYALLEKFPEYQACSAGNITGCYLLQFGDCADNNPRVAIPACTRQLALQDNRRAGVNLRFERAVRYLLRATAYTIQGDLDRALSDYDRAVTADGRTFWIHAIRGDAYFLAGIYDEALVSYNRVLALEEDEASALSNRSLVLAAAPEEELRDALQALDDARRVNTLMPGQPAFMDVLAIAYAANGDFDSAVAEEQRAIDLLPREDQALQDSYRQRLRLFRNNTAYTMPGRPED